jgi:hypothetical protein
MSGWQLRIRNVLAAGALAMLAAAAPAEIAGYKCVGRDGTVLYSQVPCPGGRVVGDRPYRSTNKWKEPPQDRAKIARRALLSAEDRQECSVLDVRMREQETLLKAKGAAVTLDDEMPLVQNKKRFRELRC